MSADPRRVKDLFAAALDLPDPAERAAFLARECGGDADLRRRLDVLLAAHDRPDAALGQPFPAPSAADGDTTRTANPDAEVTAALPDPSAVVGTVVAEKYKLLQQIGEGGMGTVWMADQTEPVKRRVAVKLIRAERGSSAAILARFEAERQAIALMDHPHIAKLLDAGTEAGQPYFVMELVKGIPLNEFCDAHKLSVPDRLALFMQVCGAVQHAHQKGVIHRDLKPTNVLVESHDGKPVPKVIDFGLAKATSGLQLTEHTLFTAFGSVMGTPLYMAPEQATFNAVDIDTRADIYALGVILYELLTGTTPLTREEIKRVAFEEMLRVIREQEPPTPSKRLSSTDSKPSVAANRQTVPMKLGRFVRGELDWVVMKALAKDRDRRYETANGFAKDVERFLNHEPVAAGPPSAAYRLRKFVRRNRGQVIAAGVVFFTLVAGIVGTTWGFVEARDQRNEAVRAQLEEQRLRGIESDLRQVAETRRIVAEDQTRLADQERQKAVTAKTEAEAKEAEANAVVKFFEDHVFAAGRPKGQDGGRGSTVSLRNAILASLPALDKAFADQPLVEARLRRTLGVTFSYLGEPEQAAEQFELTRALLTRHRGPDHPQTLASMHNLAISYDTLNRQAEALKLREEALAARKRVLPTDHPDTLNSMQHLANSYAALNRHAEALKLREETLAAQKRVLPTDHPDTLTGMNNLANSYMALSRHADALSLREETLAARKRVLSPDHPDTLSSMHNLAISYDTLNRHAEAVKLREEVLAARKRILPPDHLSTLNSMNNLANSYAALNRHPEALKLREEVLAARKRVLPPDHPDTLASMYNLAISYDRLGRFEDALKWDEEAFGRRDAVLGPRNIDTLRSLNNVIVRLRSLDRHAESIPRIDDFLSRAKGVAAPDWSARVCSWRVAHFQKLGDAAGCRATAELWEGMGLTDAACLYAAARYRAITATVQATAKSPDAATLAQADADRAMAWLTKAVAVGFRDRDHLERDADLDALRSRADFRTLLATLPEPAPPPRERK